MVAVKKWLYRREELTKGKLDEILNEYRNVKITFLNDVYCEVKAWNRKGVEG